MSQRGIYGTQLMGKHLSFISIFKTNFVANEKVRIASHPVKVEIFKGKKTYKIPVQVAYRFPENEERTVAVIESLNLDDGHYIEIKVRTKIKDADKARTFCEKEIDRTISMLVSIYNLHLFDMLVYRGWLVEKDWGVLGGWTQSIDEPKIQIKPKDLESELSIIRKKLRGNSDWYNRFTLMSRFLSKALMYTEGEEKFLLLWTALEVFPMKNTSNIDPISTCLGKILSKEVNLVKEKLEIGKLYGLRCSLVHDGEFSVNKLGSSSHNELENERRVEHSQSDTFARLEYILREVMRYMCGLPYGGSLDRYL